ncbi:ABC transporter substrate-binding protein, partial [Streptomyces scabiei]
TVSKNTWINQLIEICHGSNVFANNRTDYPLISIENVIVAKPEVIILPEEKSKTKQPIIDWQQWPEVPAVKHNQFIQVNADLLHRFTTRMLD